MFNSIGRNAARREMLHRCKCHPSRRLSGWRQGVAAAGRGVPVVVPVVLVLAVVVVVCAAVEWPPSCSYGVLALIIQRWAAPPLVASITIRTVPCSPHHPRTHTHTALTAGSRNTSANNHARGPKKPNRETTIRTKITQRQRKRRNETKKKMLLATLNFTQNGPPSCVSCVFLVGGRHLAAPRMWNGWLTWDRVGNRELENLSPGKRAPDAHSTRNRWRWRLSARCAVPWPLN